MPSSLTFSSVAETKRLQVATAGAEANLVREGQMLKVAQVSLEQAEITAKRDHDACERQRELRVGRVFLDRPTHANPQQDYGGYQCENHWPSQASHRFS